MDWTRKYHLPGIKIDHCSTISAYSVVTKYVPDYSIVERNLTKLIRKIFDNELIDLLLNLKWWNFNSDKLVDFYLYYVYI